MSTTTKKTVSRGVRYNDAEKKEVVDFILSYNAANGRGGQSKAGEKYKISQITIAGWLKSLGSSASKASTEPKAADAPKANKVPKVSTEPKAKAKNKKAAKAPQAVVKNKAGARYTDEQKKEVIDFVASYNAANGRGGQSQAATKFNVSPLTVMAWLKGSGGKGAAKKALKKGAGNIASTKATKAQKSSAPAQSAKSGGSGGFDVKLSSLLALSKEIAKTEATLAQLNAKFSTLKASL